jgi:hypothetical protein
MNFLFSPQQIDTEKARLRAVADKAHEAYPQYAGHWDGPEWKLGIVVKNVKTKTGLAFQVNDWILVKVSGVIPSGPYSGMLGFTGYSFRNGVDTALLQENFRFVEGVESWA